MAQVTISPEGGTWEYQVLAAHATPGYSSISAPVSGYSSAAGPFGNGVLDANIGRPSNGLWPIDTVLWVRKTIVAQPNQAVSLVVTAENGCIVFANGVLIGSVNRDNIQSGTVPPPSEITVPRANVGAAENIEIVAKAFDESPAGVTTFLGITIFGETAEVAISGKPLLAWDAGTARRPYRWRSRLHLNPVPTSYQAAQVRALDYDDLTLRVIADGVVLFERVITSDQQFVIPPLPQRGTYIELAGTSRVYLVEIAEDMEELS